MKRLGSEGLLCGDMRCIQPCIQPANVESCIRLHAPLCQHGLELHSIQPLICWIC